MELPYDATTQDYIKVICLLEKEHRVARVTDIAQQRGVTKSSVSLVMRHLQEKALIDRKQYGHITLTRSGRRLGNSLLRRHELLKLFLIEMLGVSPAAAEEDACKLEHAFSTETWNKFKQFVSVIEQCPQKLTDVLSQLQNCGKYAGGDMECSECPAASIEMEHE